MIASSLAQSLMEQQVSVGFACADLAPQKVVFQKGIDDLSETLEFTSRVKVNDSSGSGAPLVKQVLVEVVWQESGQERRVRLQSYVSWKN